MNNYVVSKDRDETGKEFWYCHHRDFPRMPVFGSIGSYQKAKAACDLRNMKGMRK